MSRLGLVVVVALVVLAFAASMPNAIACTVWVNSTNGELVLRTNAALIEIYVWGPFKVNGTGCKVYYTVYNYRLPGTGVFTYINAYSNSSPYLYITSSIKGVLQCTSLNMVSIVNGSILVKGAGPLHIYCSLVDKSFTTTINIVISIFTALALALATYVVVRQVVM